MGFHKPTPSPSINIVAAVSPYVDLKRRGNVWVGACPFHLEEDPSFTVYPDTNSFYCFGCKRSGSPYWFLRLMGKTPTFSQTARLSKVSVDRPKPIDIRVALYWHRCLKDRRPYFQSRGFSDALINRELWGWSPSHRRFTLPVWEGEPQKSKLINVRMRSPDSNPRYIGFYGHNYPQLYNRWVLAQKPERVFITFGEFDAKAFEMMGEAAVSPTAGVGSFQEEWVKWFDGIPLIGVCPDNTPSEFESTSKVLAKFPGRAQWFFFPQDCKDGNDYLLKHHTLELFFNHNRGIHEAMTQQWEKRWRGDGCTVIPSLAQPPSP